MGPWSAEAFFGVALRLAALGHFILIAAIVQVPARLGWKEDLPRLRPFNRKLMLVYGGFTAFTIVSFGILTLVLHREILAGERSALALAAFIGAYWLLRLGVDLFYFGHRDWPAGRALAAGHVLLGSLFFCLTATYLGIVLWHLAFRRS